jgi:TRAP-type C4-dicarboxylate transport system substrate-binding protein
MKTMSMQALVAAGALVVAAPHSAFAADYTLSVNTALAITDPLYKGLESFVTGVS